jgi:hypothetical protein
MAVAPSAATIRDRELRQLTERILLFLENERKFTSLKKLTERLASQPTPQAYATMVDEMAGVEGVFLLTAKQAVQLKSIMKSKSSSTIPYQFEHVLCSRTIDFWNLEEFGGCGYCYCMWKCQHSSSSLFFFF